MFALSLLPVPPRALAPLPRASPLHACAPQADSHQPPSAPTSPPLEGQLEEVPSDANFQPMSDGQVQGMHIDQAALMEDMRTYSRREQTPEERAASLPAWAAAFILDDDVREAYERDISAATAREYRVVEGRTWEELNHDGDLGLSSFTAHEIAEDYMIPEETVLTFMKDIGVDISESNVKGPLKKFCSEKQVNEMLSFVASTDPIAAREALSDATILDISAEGEGETPLSAEMLVQLCKRHEIPLVLGINTRLNHDDYEALIALADREAAFM